jgi:hypothetical protein
MLLVLQLSQANNLCLVVLFLGCCFNSYLINGICQTLSVNKMNQSFAEEVEEEE